MRRTLTSILATGVVLSGLTATAVMPAQAVSATPAGTTAQGYVDPCDPGRNARGWNARECRTANWMGRTFHKAPGTVLADMLIPGTHDSGAYAIRDTAPCAPQVIAGASAVFKTAAERNPCVAAALARAQDRNLGKQLRDGVRYLDIRVGVPADEIIDSPRPPARNPLRVPLVMQHNYVSASLDRGLTQVLRFAARHPREVIILDFQHLDLIDDPAINRYYEQALIGVLRQLSPAGMSDTVCSRAWTPKTVGAGPRKLATTVPVRRAWRTDRNLVVLMDPDLPANSCYYDRSQAIMSPWPNTDIPEVSRSANESYLKERSRRLRSGDCLKRSGENQTAGYWCGLFVNQMQLTPSTTRYAQCVFGEDGQDCSLAALAALVNNKVAAHLTKWTDTGRPTNIAMVDYYEQSSPDIVQRLIRLNRQRVG